MEEALAALMHYLSAHDGASTARVARQLGLAQSQLLRLLAVLGDDAALGGLGLVEQRGQGTRSLLHLTPRGRDWLERAP